MPDVYIGGNVTLRITDEGYNVSFWVLTDQYTYNHQQQWSWSDSGVMTFDMNNRGSWQLVGRVGIPNSRNVGWTLYNSGIGFPTGSVSMWVSRATVPPPPYFVDVRATGTNTIHTQFYSGGDGGTPIREWQLAYGMNPNGADYYIGSNGINDTWVGVSGAWWYFWARGRNDVGWGGWSGRTQAFTWRVPDAPSPVYFSLITQRSIRAQFNGGFDGGEPVDEWQLAYGLSSDVNLATLLTSNGTSDLSNLDPGKMYYFWARGRNAVGWGPWSPIRSQALRAGAVVKDDGVWKRALPFVNDNGVWKLAKPYAKQAGVWKETA
jgi:hypothetical protein